MYNANQTRAWVKFTPQSGVQQGKAGQGAGVWAPTCTMGSPACAEGEAHTRSRAPRSSASAAWRAMGVSHNLRRSQGKGGGVRAPGPTGTP